MSMGPESRLEADTAGGPSVAGLPEQLPPVDVPDFLLPYGFHAASHLQWRGQLPELAIKVTSHSQVGKHTFYHLECKIARQKTGEERVVWHAARRLAHLREGLHDPIKKALGSSYQTYFCRVHFAHHLRPAGTTARLDAWCRRLAYCVTAKLVPPEMAAHTLRVLGAPCLTELEAPGGGQGEGAALPRVGPLDLLAVPAATSSGLPGSCGAASMGMAAGGLYGNCSGVADCGDDPDKDGLASEGASASTADPFANGVAASLFAAAAVTSTGDTSDCSGDSDGTGDDDMEPWDDEDLADAVLQKVGPGAATFDGEVYSPSNASRAQHASSSPWIGEDTASLDPFAGHRRMELLQ